MAEWCDRCQFDYSDQKNATIEGSYDKWPWQRLPLASRLFLAYYPHLGLSRSAKSLEHCGFCNPLIRVIGRMGGKETEKSLMIDEGNRNLQPGDWVEVRSMEEVFATLDERGKNRGMGFMPEMEQFCGKKFQVYKRVNTIVLETTGEQRKIMSPTVFLKGVECDGSFHGGCDRSCYCFWREVWLKTASPEKHSDKNEATEESETVSPTKN